MTLEQVTHQRDLFWILEALEVDHVDIAVQRERSVGVEDIGDASAHAGREVSSSGAEHDDAPAGHVLAAVIADALDDRVRTAVANREPLAGNTTYERRAA